MNKLKLILIILVLQLIFVPSVLAEVDFSQELFTELADSINGIPYIETPDYTRIELDNGMIVYLAEDNELPIVEIKGYIKGGRSQESQELAGISSIMVKLMNTGTKNYSEAELSRYKELNGLSFDLFSSNDRYSFSANSLSIDQKELISLIAEILINPEFEADYYYRIIQEYYQLVLQQYYNDSSLLDMFFTTNLYGDHPYSYSSNIGLVISALERMTPIDVEKFYQETIGPANMIIAISGDIELKEMEGLIKEKFGDWESKGVELKEAEVIVDEENYNKIILINKEDATHARMRMGYNFYDSRFEDRVPFMMANRIFGGGDFSSRLMDNLRTQRGYVYGIYSGITYNQLGGVYFISTDVDPGKAYETMEAIKEEMLAISEGKEEISEEELFMNVNLYNALFPKAYKNQLSVLSKLMFDIEFMDEDEDSINSFVKEYNELTASQVQEVFVEHTYPERFLTVIVARKDDILPVFQEQGIEVEVIDLF